MKRTDHTSIRRLMERSKTSQLASASAFEPFQASRLSTENRCAQRCTFTAAEQAEILIILS